MTTTNQVTPGWYPDPSNAGQLRWYDGAQWTQSVHPAVAPAQQAQPAQAPTAAPYQAPPQQPPFGYQGQPGQSGQTGQYGTQPGQGQPGQPGQQQYGNQPYGAQQQMPSNGCTVCGAVPAMQVHLRGHQGMLFVMRWFSYRGQYCRDCGTAKFREVQRATMLAGWWGYFSFIANTYNVFHNMNVERGLRSLGAPQGRLRAPKPPVQTVFKSPGFAVTLCLPVVLWFLYQAAITG